MTHKTLYTLAIFIILSMLHTVSYAQNIATAVMTASVEVVSGSSVEVSNFDMIASDEASDMGSVYAVITITHNQDEVLLTTFSDSVDLVNGDVSHNLDTKITESRTSDSVIRIQLKIKDSSQLNSGLYSGKQVAEIIYL